MPKKPDGFCICCGKGWHKDWEYCDSHHRWPKSQNGPDTDKNLVMVCRSCHELYNNICGQVLASKVKARIINFVQWMKEFPDVKILDKNQGKTPANMAPDFVHDEVGQYMYDGSFTDFSKGCLSRLGKVSVYPPRNTFK